jgi:hypothetical protein
MVPVEHLWDILHHNQLGAQKHDDFGEGRKEFVSLIQSLVFLPV